MRILCYSSKTKPLTLHHYYMTQAGEMTPAFDAEAHQSQVAILLEAGIITPSVQQRDRITEIEVAYMPRAWFDFTADE